jgi:type III secretory pathway lipoprotein EscJ
MLDTSRKERHEERKGVNVFPRAVLLAIALISLLLSGCSEEQLKGGLTEEVALELIHNLSENGVEAKKSRSGGGYSVTVASADFDRALSIISEQGLLHTEPDAASTGFIPELPEVSAARKDRLRARELERLVRAIPGVRSCIAVIESSALPDARTPETRASIVVKARAGSNLTRESVASVVSNVLPEIAADKLKIEIVTVAGSAQVASDIVKLPFPLAFHILEKEQAVVRQQAIILLALVLLCGVGAGLYLGGKLKLRAIRNRKSTGAARGDTLERRRNGTEGRR